MSEVKSISASELVGLKTAIQVFEVGTGQSVGLHCGFVNQIESFEGPNDTRIVSITIKSRALGTDPEVSTTIDVVLSRWRSEMWRRQQNTGSAKVREADGRVIDWIFVPHPDGTIAVQVDSGQFYKGAHMGDREAISCDDFWPRDVGSPHQRMS